MDFESIATFPIGDDDDDWVLTLLIGGGLVFLGFLLVPILIVYGYVMDVMRGAVEGETDPPEFDAWGDLLVDGAKGFVVTLAYQVVPAVVGGGLMAVLLLAGFALESGGLTFLGFALGGLAWLVLSAVFGYVGMAAVVNVAVEDEITAAFDVETLRTVVTSTDWLLAWTVYLALSFVASIVGAFGITYPFATFYALSAGGQAFGEAFASATGVGERAPDAAAAEATAADPA